MFKIECLLEFYSKLNFQISKNFQVYFIHINFLKKPKKKIYNRVKELYYDATILFFDSSLSTCPKKWKLKNGPRLPTLPYTGKSFFHEYCVLVVMLWLAGVYPWFFVLGIIEIDPLFIASNNAMQKWLFF